MLQIDRYNHVRTEDPATSLSIEKEKLGSKNSTNKPNRENRVTPNGYKRNRWSSLSECRELVVTPLQSSQIVFYENALAILKGRWRSMGRSTWKRLLLLMAIPCHVLRYACRMDIHFRFGLLLECHIRRQSKFNL